MCIRIVCAYVYYVCIYIYTCNYIYIYYNIYIYFFFSYTLSRRSRAVSIMLAAGVNNAADQSISRQIHYLDLPKPNSQMDAEGPRRIMWGLLRTSVMLTNLTRHSLVDS